MKHVSPADFDTPVAALLRKGLAYLDAHGWCQNALSGSGGQVCALGALIYGRGNGSFVPPDEIEKQALGVLREVTGEWLLADWNNAPGRTLAEVREAFLKTIDRANAKEG